MAIPDPATLIGQRCHIKLKKQPGIIRKILAIDIQGVRVEEADGSTTTYPFEDIDMATPRPER